jgi:hypothetical protein
MEDMKSHLKGFEFHSFDTFSHFDPIKIKGYVAKVIDIEDSYLEWVNALEICAGNRLFNVSFLHVKKKGRYIHFLEFFCIYVVYCTR